MKREGAIETRRQDIVNFLTSRFGPTAEDLEVELAAVEFDRLSDRVEFGATCRNLASFRKRVSS